MFLLSDEKDRWKSFNAVQEERREQAARSVLISYPPKTSKKKIVNYLSRHGDIKKYFSYESYVSESLLTTDILFTNMCLCDSLQCHARIQLDA